jgi:hypothetical protein
MATANSPYGFVDLRTKAEIEVLGAHNGNRNLSGCRIVFGWP